MRIPNTSVDEEAIARVLRTLDSLFDGGERDLDEVDGEFYWRCVRPEVAARIDSARRQVTDFMGGRLDHPRFVAAMGDPGPAGGDAWNLAMSVDAAMKELRPDFPNAMDRLWTAGRFRMRESCLELHQFKAVINLFALWGEIRPLGAGVVVARVFSSGKRGKQTEREIRAYAAQAKNVWEPNPPYGEEESHIHTAMRFVESGPDPQFEGDPNPFRLPHIEVRAALPLPPDGVLAELYDAVAIDQYRWHERLTGEVNKQTDIVAARTWAIGLLVGIGLTRSQAMHRVVERLGTGLAISSQRFDEDRATLLRRVPEALPAFSAAHQG